MDRAIAVTARKKAHCDEALAWLKQRGWSLAGLTAQDRSCLQAISHAWAMYFHSDAAGQSAAIDAVGIMLDGCQEMCWPMARELIAQAGDWGHRADIWPRVVDKFGIRAGMAGAYRLRICHVGIRLVEGGA